VDHEAFVANRRGDHERALERYQSLPAADAHPFASYRRDAGNGGDGARATALRSVSAQPPATALRPPPEPGGVAVVKVAAPMSPAPASCAPNGLGNSELEASAPRRSRRSGSPKSRAPRAASAPAGATSRSSRPG
jgi:hypothetical protein